EGTFLKDLLSEGGLLALLTGSEGVLGDVLELLLGEEGLLGGLIGEDGPLGGTLEPLLGDDGLVTNLLNDLLSNGALAGLTSSEGLLGANGPLNILLGEDGAVRSEERRVGKE